MWGKIKENWAKYLALGIGIIFILLGAYIAIKPGWKEYKGDEFSIKYPSLWLVEGLERGSTFHGEETLLFMGDRPFLQENIRMTISRTSKDFSDGLKKSNTQVGGFRAYVGVAESTGKIYRKEIIYSIETKNYIYEIVTYIFRKGTSSESYKDEFIVRNIATSLRIKE